MQRGWKSAAWALVATAALASSAFAQRGGGFGRGGGGGMNMLTMPEVQTELKLTDEQKTKVTDLAAKLREQRQSQFQELRDLAPDERQKRMADWRAEEDKQLGDILNADQMKRYHQLQLQQQGLSAAVTDKTVADELKLTDEQKTKIQAIVDDQRNAMRELFQGGGGGADRQAMMQKMQELRKQSDEKIAAVLTDDQKGKWKEMTGAPFTFPAPRLGNRGAA
jgi:Spy/CpxP family protein refolding chaperone